MIDLKSILKTFAYFVLIFSGLLGFSSLENVEKRLGKWFIKSSSTLFEWTMPKAAINVEHDRNFDSYNPNEVWISPMSRAVIQDVIKKSKFDGRPIEVDNGASLLFKIGTFPKTALVFLLALVLATPMLLRNKMKALFISLLVFMIYFYFFLYVSVLHHIAATKIGVYELEGTSMKILNFFKNTFCNFGFSLTFSLMVWMITCIDFNKLFNQFNSSIIGGSPKKPIKSKTGAKSKSKAKKNKTK